MYYIYLYIFLYSMVLFHKCVAFTIIIVIDAKKEKGIRLNTKILGISILRLFDY
jgi:hypothetical protein